MERGGAQGWVNVGGARLLHAVRGGEGSAEGNGLEAGIIMQSIWEGMWVAGGCRVYVGPMA